MTVAEFTPNGTYLVVLTADGALRAIRLNDRTVQTWPSRGRLDVSGVALGADARVIWIGSQGNVERFTRLALPQEVWIQPFDVD